MMVHCKRRNESGYKFWGVGKEAAAVLKKHASQVPGVTSGIGWLFRRVWSVPNASHDLVYEGVMHDPEHAQCITNHCNIGFIIDT